LNAPRDWKALERHPLSAEYVDINGPQWEAFVGALRLHGILNDRKITLAPDPDDGGKLKVLDGWQLLRGCIDADIKPKFQPLPDGIDPEVFVEVMNDRRRHEDAETTRKRAEARRQRVDELRRQGESLPTIAAKEEISVAQVQRDLDKVGSTLPGGKVEPENGQVTGLDGRKRRSPKKKKKKALRPRQKDNTDKAGVLLDALDCPVPPGLVPVFNKGKSFRDIVNRLAAINQELVALKQSPAGAVLRLPQVQVDLKNLKDAVHFDTPYCVCPVCQGVATTRKANCPCKGRGWLIEQAYRALPTEYRQ
jgi:hypothetical protein